MVLFNNKNYKYLLLSLLLIITFVFASPSMAARPTFKDAEDNLFFFAFWAGYGPLTDETSLETLIGQIISIVLSVMGIIYFIIVIYGGYLWFSAAGNKEQVTKAIHLLRDATIGLALVIGAYALAYFVLYNLIYEHGVQYYL